MHRIHTVDNLLAFIQVHRWLLRLSSDYFAALLRSDSAEAQAGRVALEGTTEEALEALVHFIYTADLPHSCQQLPTLVDTLVLADRLVRFVCE